MALPAGPGSCSAVPAIPDGGMLEAPVMMREPFLASNRHAVDRRARAQTRSLIRISALPAAMTRPTGLSALAVTVFWAVLLVRPAAALDCHGNNCDLECPEFVASISSPWPDARTSVRCWPGAPCEFSVFARIPMSMVDPSSALSIFLDNSTTPISMGDLVRHGGGPCVSSGADPLGCIFSLSGAVSDGTDVCFVARVANASFSCKSVPWCLRLVSNDCADSFSGQGCSSCDQNSTNRACVSTCNAYSTCSDNRRSCEEQLLHLRPSASGITAETIRLSWMWIADATVPSDFDHYEFQFARDDGNFCDLSVDFVSIPIQVSVEFPANKIIDASKNFSAHTDLFFRVVVVRTSGRRYVSVRSNSLRVFNQVGPTGRLHLVTWHSQLLSVHRMNALGQYVSVFEHHSHPISPGGSAVDSMRSMLFVVSEQAPDAIQPAQTILTIDLDDPQNISQISLEEFQNTSFWNLQIDESDGNLLMITVNSSGSAIVTLDALNGGILASDPLPSHPRQAVSAMDSRTSIYWFVDSLGGIRSYQRVGGTVSAGLDLCFLTSLATCDDLVVMKMAFDTNRNRLHSIIGPWQGGKYPSTLTLVTLNPVSLTGTVVKPTSLPAFDFSLFAFDYDRNYLYTVHKNSKSSSMVVYDIDRNTPVHEEALNVKVVDLNFQSSRVPVIKMLAPGHVPGDPSVQVTVSG